MNGLGVPTKNSNQKSFSCFAVLMALCAAAHVSVHLPQATFSASWVLGVAIFLIAMQLIYQPSVRVFLGLAALQVAHVVVDAPYNPDHWLLLFFVNLVILTSAIKVWRKDHAVTPERLMETLAPGTRLVFLVCYGFAAFAKFNFDFLFSEHSVALEMLGYQIGAMPSLSWIIWPPAIPWVTLGCEAAIPLLLLLPNRTRHLGILIGVFFHAALIISPAIKVFDFTIVVYTMLYLFTPAGFERNLRQWLSGIRKQAPHLWHLLSRLRGIALLTPAIALIVTSTSYPLLEIPPRLLWLRWMVAMSIICGLGGLCMIGLFSGDRQKLSLEWFPRWGLPYAVVGLAIVNGLCPYLGLKTQGSFTMFSNLQTEAGAWNHLLMPESVRVVGQYQDRLVRVLASNDPELNRKYIEPGLLAPEFELRRRIMQQPSLSLTMADGDQEVEINPASQDAILGTPIDLLSRKLLIFRPVSPDGRPFTTN